MFEVDIDLPLLEAPRPRVAELRRPPRGSEIVEGEEWAEFFPSVADQWVIQIGCEPIGEYTMRMLALVDPDELSAAGQIKALRILTEYDAWVQSRRVEFRAEFAGAEPTTLDGQRDDFAAQELALAERCTVQAAQSRARVARELTGRLPRTLAAMRCGRMLPGQAEVLADTTYPLSDEVTTQLETQLLRFCHRQDVGLFRKALKRWLPKLDPDWEEKAKAAREDATVAVTPLGDGTAEMYLKGPLEIVESVNRSLCAEAARTKSLLGGAADQRKLIALRDMTQRYLADPMAARQHGRLPEVQVAIDLTTLLGLRSGVAEIPGVGAVPADTAAWLLRDGAPLRRLVTDPETGALLDYGTRTYLVPPPLADQLIAQHVTSASPYSGVPARGCDMEHNVPAEIGGTTDPDNNTPIDRPWHRAKTHGDWTYRKNPKTKRVTWTSPAGQTCTIDPYDYRI